MHQSWLSYTQTYSDRNSNIDLAIDVQPQLTCKASCFLCEIHGNACRMTPNKKSMAAAFAVFGSSVSGLVRYLFGRWIPSWQQLVYNKVKYNDTSSRH